MKNLLPFAVAVLFLVHQAIAGEVKMAVSVKHVGNDAVGNRFAYALREEIAKSARYQIFSEHKLQPGSGVLEIEAVSVDAQTSEQGISSAVSVLITFRIERPMEQRTSCGDEERLILQHEVYAVGANRVDQIAKDVMSEIDKAAEGMNK
jgi:hypothetical protein